VSVGGGAFDDLDRLRPGNRLRVGTRAGVIDYEVTRVTIYRKSTLAQHAARVFSQSVRGRLVLVTCEDWDGTTYLSNAVVFAKPAR
jgi:LPXTG-site transpeptidase (sortase) family protein